MKKINQSAVVFLNNDELPPRERVETALEGLGGCVEWHEEHELGATYAFSVELEGGIIGVSVIGGPLERELYDKPLETSGLPDDDRQAIEGHGTHARIVFMEERGDPIEPVLRMTHVYRIAARLSTMDGVAVLAPGSGVFVMGLGPEHVDNTIDDEVPPLDMWIAVEKTGDDVAKSVGAKIVGIPEVELTGIGLLDAETTFCTVMDALLYLRRIRRELVPGEVLHIGRQPWDWMTLKGPEGLVKMKRVDPEAARSVRDSSEQN